MVFCGSGSILSPLQSSVCLYMCVILYVCVCAHACHKQLLLQCLGLRVLFNASVSQNYFIYLKRFIMIENYMKIDICCYKDECKELCANVPVDIIEILAH